MRVWRTDADESEDVPTLGPETDDNTDYESKQYSRAGKKLYRGHTDLWRGEWIEPAARSERVRGDDPTEQVHFIIDAAGDKQPDTLLNDEDVGRYLWFSPHVIPALLKWRDSELKWYTRDTGSVSCSYGHQVHFGLNTLGLVTVYAYDVARLPLWQRKLWAGHNIAPEGAVSSELFQAQMRSSPAQTFAAEEAINDMLEILDERVTQWAGGPLFQQHTATSEVIKAIHRFRALDLAGLLSLAKDIARVIADRLHVPTLRRIVRPPEGEDWRGMKSLEKALGTIVPPEDARHILTPLVGVYQLRLGDAHLPSSELDEAFAMINIDRKAPFVSQDSACWRVSPTFSFVLPAQSTMQRTRPFSPRVLTIAGGITNWYHSRRQGA